MDKTEKEPRTCQCDFCGVKVPMWGAMDKWAIENSKTYCYSCSKKYGVGWFETKVKGQRPKQSDAVNSDSNSLYYYGFQMNLSGRLIFGSGGKNWTEKKEEADTKTKEEAIEASKVLSRGVSGSRPFIAKNNAEEVNSVVDKIWYQGFKDFFGRRIKKKELEFLA